MLKIYQFECNECGHQFEEYVDDDNEKPKCPKCKKDDTRRVVGQPAHRKHSSWSQF
jgi:putative FmdB family regulatory protein